MDRNARKMSRIIDELVCFCFSVGSSGVKMDLERVQDGYQLTLDSNYAREEHRRVQDLDRFLNVTEKYEGMEEFSWQLAGVSALGQDSELTLIGQMIDKAELEIGEDTIHMVLFKQNAGSGKQAANQ